MMYVNQATPAAVYTGWRLGGWIHQPRVEPNQTGNSIHDTMAFPPTMTGLRSFP